MRAARGFTLVELMVVIAVVGVLLMLAAPSFRDFMLVQRLKGIQAQLVTDLQYARSEAAARGAEVHVQFKLPSDDVAMSCYTLYVDTGLNPFSKCDCDQPPGARCPAPTSTEIRTVQIPVQREVRLALPSGQAQFLAFFPTTGAIRIGDIEVAGRLRDFVVTAAIDDARMLRTTIGRSGRPTVCSPGGGVRGFESC